MQSQDYRNALAEAIVQLAETRQQVFDCTFRIAIAGELKEWADEVPPGEIHHFEKDIFEGCNDINLQLMTNLLTQLETTVDSLCNLNKLDFPEPDDEEPKEF